MKDEKTGFVEIKSHEEIHVDILNACACGFC